jgi:pimeloyl-ACP methyl ester carboxylesterase
MPKIAVSDGELYYEEFGSGDEIIVSAQMDFTGRAYPKLLAEAPSRYRVLQFWLRGYGQSTPVTTDLGRGWYPQWAEDIYQATQALNLGRFIYTGVSHGSGVGWHLALAHPETLKGFVAVVGAPHSRAGGLESSAGRREMLGAGADPDRLRASIRATYPIVSTDPQRQLQHEEMIERQVAGMLDPDRPRWNQGKPLPQAVNDEQLAALLTQVTVPTLLVCGIQDTIITPEMVLLAGRSVPGARTVFFQDYGHELSGLNPGPVMDQVRLFVDELNAQLRRMKAHA